jgi:membrane protease YdiL (CAAX protease family)
MTASRPFQSQSKSVLVAGAVRPWHIAFLFSVCFVVGHVASFYLTRTENPVFRGQLRGLVFQGIYGGLMLAIIVIVPELRRSLRILFSRRSVEWIDRDLALAFSLLLLWGYGMYRIAICYPAILADLEMFRVLGYGDSAAPFESKHLVWVFSSVIFAPLAEELVFRGFLLNLWMARWGAWPAIILSSVFFGLFHAQLAIFATICGVVFALAYLKYDSLWPAIILHGAYNLLASTWLLGRVFYIKEKAAVDQISNWVPELILAALFIPALIVFLRRFRPAPIA